MKPLCLTDPLIAQNTYLFADKGEAVVIDPGFNGEALLNILGEKNLRLSAVLLTHGHYDHLRDLRLLQKERDFPLYLHEEDVPNLWDDELNGSRYFHASFALKKSQKVVPFRDGEELRFGDLAVKVLHTPGHTAGSSCFLWGKTLFSGDTLFAGDLGRTDLPGGSPEKMRQSVERLFTVLGNEVLVLPGHEESTTIGNERKTNYGIPERLRRG